MPRTALVCLENTQNSCGGTTLTQDDMQSVASVAHDHGLSVHVDGARIFNAAVALEAPVAELAQRCRLGHVLPVQGAELPSWDLSSLAPRTTSRRLGAGGRWSAGSMRQAGVLAAAGVVALDSMVDRLAEDHANARKLSEGLAEIDGIDIDPDALPTNLVFFEIERDDWRDLHRQLVERGVKGGGGGRRWRYVTHYGITEEDIDYTLETVRDVFAGG